MEKIDNRRYELYLTGKSMSQIENNFYESGLLSTYKSNAIHLVLAGATYDQYFLDRFGGEAFHGALHALNPRHFFTSDEAFRIELVDQKNLNIAKKLAIDVPFRCIGFIGVDKYLKVLLALEVDGPDEYVQGLLIDLKAKISGGIQ
jgi:hypothetical protein